MAASNVTISLSDRGALDEEYFAGGTGSVNAKERHQRRRFGVSGKRPSWLYDE